MRGSRYRASYQGTTGRASKSRAADISLLPQSGAPQPTAQSYATRFLGCPPSFPFFFAALRFAGLRDSSLRHPTPCIRA